MTAYRAIGGTTVGRLHKTGHGADRVHRTLRPCTRCGVLVDRRHDQDWCFDCTQAERPASAKIRRALAKTEAEDDAILTAHGLAA